MRLRNPHAGDAGRKQGHDVGKPCLRFPQHRIVNVRRSHDAEAQIANHYDVLSRDLTSVKAILTKALTALDHPKAGLKARGVAYWRNRLKHAVSLVEMADNEGDLMREVAVDPGPQNHGEVSKATLASPHTLYSEAFAGQIVGIAYVAIRPGGREYAVHTSGEAERSPTFTRGALRALDDMLSEKLNRV